MQGEVPHVQMPTKDFRAAFASIPFDVRRARKELGVLGLVEAIRSSWAGKSRHPAAFELLLGLSWRHPRRPSRGLVDRPLLAPCDYRYFAGAVQLNCTNALTV